MKAYTAYKNWWKETQAPGLIPSLYWGETVDAAFEAHVNRQLGLFKLMEKLERWDEDE
jgi:hypothetical protein